MLAFMFFWLNLILFRALPTFQIQHIEEICLCHTLFWQISWFLWNCWKLFRTHYPGGCSMVCFITQQSSFVVPAIYSLVPGVFYVRNLRDSLLADKDSAGLKIKNSDIFFNYISHNHPWKLYHIVSTRNSCSSRRMQL